MKCFCFRIGDIGRTVSVLKLDVEGEEVNSVPQMVTSNMFSNIKQMHLEVRNFLLFMP